MPGTDPRHKKTLIDYDANGNQLTTKRVIYEGDQPDAFVGITEPVITTLHKNLWDEEDRLRAVDLNPDEPAAHPLAVYTYDAAGMRAVRYVPGRLDAWSNANSVSRNERDEVMLYPSALVTAKALSIPGNVPQPGNLVSNYTKHYYIGMERVSSRIGTAKDLGLFPPKVDGLFPGIRTKANESVTNANTGLTHTYTQLEQTISLTQVNEGNELQRFTHDPNKYDAYWYHSDHLGSSSYITNLAGTVTQHIEYLPFGETLVDEHLNSYNSPFKFNAKELDPETGNYYYGARYYNPKWSIWLSVDPLAEKYPGISSYAYVANNPINAIDPDGREIIIITERDKNGKVKELLKYSNGHLYTIDGKKYKGKNEFALTIKNAFNDIRKADTYIDKMVNELEGSSTLHFIEYSEISEGAYVTKNKNSINGNGTHVIITDDELLSVPLYSGEDNNLGSVLSHELQHVFDIDMGIIDRTPDEQSGIRKSEIKAVNTENRYRANRGMKIRTHYGEGNEIPKSKLEDPCKPKEFCQP